MMIFIYDGTFEGLLTSLFEAYYRRSFPDAIQTAGKQPQDMFAVTVKVISDSAKAGRVWKGIQEKLTVRNRHLLYHAFLSEAEGIEIKIMRFVRRLFYEGTSIETDFGDANVLDIIQNARKVRKEAMHVMQFVRFQQTKDGMYFCGIEPLYDVIPLVAGHFKSRFADQQWLLYDLKHNYGIYYNKETLEEVEITSSEFNRQTGEINEDVLNEGDALYQTLWKSYIRHISIEERKNLRLQRQHMPRRFWKYLTEKQ